MSATIVPFDSFPDCAYECGPLHDAQGGCVPPEVPVSDDATYKACFCTHSGVAGFRTGKDGVCDHICAHETTDVLRIIQNWFADICDVPKVGATDGDSAAGSGSGSGTTRTNLGSGKSWIEMHYKWLIVIIVIAVAIIVVWIGACFWRRRHVKRKERMHNLGKRPAVASWGPGAAPPDLSSGPPGTGGPGMFMSPASGSTGVSAEKPVTKPPKTRKFLSRS